MLTVKLVDTIVKPPQPCFTMCGPSESMSGSEFRKREVNVTNRPEHTNVPVESSA